MAFDFFSTSSSDKAGLGSEGGGVGALSRLTAEQRDENTNYNLITNITVHLINIFPLFHPFLIFTLFLRFYTCEVSAWTPVPASSVPASSVPASCVPATSVPATSVPATSVPATSVPATSVPATSVSIVGHAGDTTHRFV